MAQFVGGGERALGEAKGGEVEEAENGVGLRRWGILREGGWEVLED